MERFRLTKCPPDMKSLKQKLSQVIRNWDGPLTQELIQSPGQFGLGNLPANVIPDDVVNMTCGFCSTGCSLDIHLKNKLPVNLTPDVEYPVNLGMACPKGWEALAPLTAPDRALTPLLRDVAGKLLPADWDDAMQAFVLRIKAIQDKHGPESVAWLGTGQIVTEELALLGALAKFGMGIIHGDANTRQCMATSVVAYKQSFGFDAPPFTYADFEQSDVIFLIGSNLCIAHPILWQRILRNPNNPQIIVIDPRKTETAAAATRHIAIQPKADLSLFYAIAKIIIQNGWIKRTYIESYTTGFEEFLSFLNTLPLGELVNQTGLSEGHLFSLAETIHLGNRVSFWWTMGVNQGHEATRTAQAIINLALMTGNIGRPGTGANSITGQCNAMGSRLFSNTTSLFGGRDFTNPSHRSEVSKILDVPESRVPAQNSDPYHRIIEKVETGEIKALWIIGTNPAHSWIDQNRFRAAIGKLELLVIQDMYFTTETAQNADIFFPAAGWGEKDGTFINSERRIGLIKKVSKAPGQALSDFNIFRLVAHYWGCAELLQRWSSPEAVFQILKNLSKGTPCDISGIKDYYHLDRAGGIQWPLKEGESEASQERRLFENGIYFHADGKAKFLFSEPREPAEQPCHEYPLKLLTGRGTSAQWHTQTRTGKSKTLQKLYSACLQIEINPVDAERLGIVDNSKVLIESRRGRILAVALVTPSLKVGEVFLPMHDSTTNIITFAEFDPHSFQPSYKFAAVRIKNASKL